MGGRPYSERMLGQVVCMTQWMQEQRAELGFSDKGDIAPCGAYSSPFETCNALLRL